MVLTNSYPFINSLMDPISGAHDQLLELGSLFSGPPGARPNDSGEPFLSLHHGSSEGHEMLKRNDKYHSIADDMPIPKM